MLRLAVLLALLPTVALADVTGPARVTDGDTIEIAGERIRLHGIDAPESNQRCRRRGVPWLCGAEASQATSRSKPGYRRKVTNQRNITEKHTPRASASRIRCGRAKAPEVSGRGYAEAPQAPNARKWSVWSVQRCPQRRRAASECSEARTAKKAQRAPVAESGQDQGRPFLAVVHVHLVVEHDEDLRTFVDVPDVWLVGPVQAHRNTVDVGDLQRLPGARG